MKVTLTARDSAVTISKKVLSLENDPNFFNQLNLEVIQSPKKARKLLKELSATHTMFASILVQRVPNTEIVPKDLTDSMFIAIAVLAALGVGIAIIALMLAGLWKMWIGKQKADEWTSNILKGLAQILLAPILVALIVGICSLLFSKLPAFQPIISPINTFFHQQN